MTTPTRLLDSCAALSRRGDEHALAEGVALLRAGGLEEHELVLAAFGVVIGVGRAFGSGELTSDEAYDALNQDWIVTLDDDWGSADPMFDLLEKLRETVAMAEPTVHHANESPGWLDLPTARDDVARLQAELAQAWLSVVAGLLERR